MALKHIGEKGIEIPSQILDGFYSSRKGEFVSKQLLFVDVVESLLKISSTVCIAVGRFYELSKLKDK